ncbi:uncharacterized protein [Misgurnus anguillicaudatus]|uniref:uncharacterized protein isoform X2 n=1 Tax=Misgurnus anguillicaudatus TaxID=75329 RepID=UPI003CCF08A6
MTVPIYDDYTVHHYNIQGSSIADVTTLTLDHETDDSDDNYDSVSTFASDTESEVDAEAFRQTVPDDPDPEMDSILTSVGTTTKAEAVLMIMTYAARHNISGTQLHHLLKLINTLFGKEVVPVSKYLFNKAFKNNSEMLEFHFYCKSCRSYIGTQQNIEEKNITQCLQCSDPLEISTLNSGSFFINVPIAPQIQALLQNPEISNNIAYRYERSKNEHIISDIYDGYMYAQLSKAGELLSDPNNFSFNFNSDGSPLYKSSKFSIWPIQLHLNELPPKIRFQNVMLAGLWFGAREPVMHIFLKPFVNQAKDLVYKGVTWRKNRECITSKIVGLCCCVDSKARPAIQNTTQLNGYFGCGFCLHPGTLVDRQVKYTITTTEYADRDAEGMLSDMELALANNSSVRGVKGPSPLINMPYFDIVWGFVPDYMHAVLLGVIRQLTELLLNNSDQPYYIGSPNIMRVIENRLRNIKPPHLITRLPRPLTDLKFWKASEWRAWLLFYSLPVLNGLLQTCYIKHLSLLVSAVFLLLKEQVSFQDVNLADEMLLEFVVRFQLLYGEASMTFNVHLLTHLAKSVKLWGPLWAHSAFVFENANGELLKLVHGTKCVALQIVNRFLSHSAIPHFTANYTISEHVQKFCLELTEHPKVKKFSTWQDTTVLDGGRVQDVTDAIRVAFLSAERHVPDEVVVHRRMVHKGLLYTSSSYSLSKRRKDCYGKLNDGCNGEILHIISFTSNGNREIALIFRKIHSQPSFPLSQGIAFVPHIKQAGNDFAPVCLISVDSLEQKCLILHTTDHTFICEFPNVYERD